MLLPTSAEIEESKRKRVEGFHRLGDAAFKKFRSEKEAAATATVATATVTTAATTAAANSHAIAQSSDDMSVTKPLTDSEAMEIQNLRRLATAHEIMPGMTSLANQEWQELKMNFEYVPPIGYECHNGQKI